MTGKTGKIKVLHGRKAYADGGTPSDDALPNLDFLRMVQENPHGWGNAPPMPQTAMEKEPWAYQGEIRNIERPGSVTLPAEQTAAEFMPLPGLPGVGPVMRTLAKPEVAGPIAGTIGMLGAMAHGSEGEESPAAQLRKQIDVLTQRQQDAYNRRETERASGIGKGFKAADAEYADLTTKIKEAQDRLTAYQNSTEGQLEVKRKADDLAAAEADRQAHLPFGEAHPYVNESLPMLRYGIAAGIPFAGTGIARAGERAGLGEANRIETALASGRDALAGSATPLQQEAAGQMLRQYANREPGWFKTGAKAVGKEGAAALVGGAAGAELNAVPDQYDARILHPGSPEQQAADARMRDPETYKWPFVFGAASGVGGKHAGSFLFGKGRTPDYAGARGMSDTLLGVRPNDLPPLPAPAAPPAAAAPKVIIVTKSKAGTLHGKGGRFTSIENEQKAAGTEGDKE